MKECRDQGYYSQSQLTEVQLHIPVIRLNQDYGDNFENYMLQYKNSSDRRQHPVVRRVGKGWTTEMLATLRRRIDASFDTTVPLPTLHNQFRV